MEQVNLLEHPAPAVGGHSLVDDLHGVLHLVQKPVMSTVYTCIQLTLFGRCVAEKCCHVHVIFQFRNELFKSVGYYLMGTEIFRFRQNWFGSS